MNKVDRSHEGGYAKE